jgi:hypothetical protein
MQDDPNPSRRGRENMLSITLTIIVGGIFLFYLYLISLGIVLNVLGIGLGLVLIGSLHYLLWGRALSEDLKRRDLEEQYARPALPPDGIQDRSRTHGIQK